MLQNAYFLAKIGADTAENEQHFAEILPIGRRVAEPDRSRRADALAALSARRRRSPLWVGSDRAPDDAPIAAGGEGAGRSAWRRRQTL